MKHSTTIVVVQEVFRFQKFAVVPEKFDFMSRVEFCQAWDFFGFYETLLGFFLKNQKNPQKSRKISIFNPIVATNQPTNTVNSRAFRH